MKRILTVLLIVSFAASTVFAGISGNASVSLGYDTTSKVFGLKNGTSVSFDIDLASESAENTGDGAIAAGIKASAVLKIADQKGDDYGMPIYTDSDTDVALGLLFSVDEAYVKGDAWKVSITGTKGAPDYAKSAIDTTASVYYDAFYNSYGTNYVATTYKVSAKKAPGVTFTYNDWTASLGFSGQASEVETYNAYVQSPSFALDALTLQLAAITSKNAGTFENATGVSAKASYTAESFTLTAAADIGLKKADADSAYVFDMDAALNLTTAPVAVDAYYNHGKELLSAKAVTDLSAFELPVKLTVTGKDLLNAKNISAKAAFSIDDISLAVSGRYVFSTSKVSASASASYETDDYSAEAGINWSNKLKEENSAAFYITAAVESSTIIPGATVSLVYDEDSAENSMNFLSGQATAQNFGAVTAKCKIAF